MMQIFSWLTADPRPFAERAGEAGRVALIGMCAIFGVLAILWGAIEVMHLFFREKKKNEKKQKVEPLAAAPVPAAQSSDNGALIAAITAAIAQARAEEGNTTGFRVVSFRRSR